LHYIPEFSFGNNIVDPNSNVGARTETEACLYYAMLKTENVPILEGRVTHKESRAYSYLEPIRRVWSAVVCAFTVLRA
jgi:hypothetical protein